MDCSSARELLPLYFDGELDRVTGRQLEEHLDGCAE
jgi:predicted anti-sigma-YlaC factor YlaD